LFIRVGEYAEEGIKAINENQNGNHNSEEISTKFYGVEDNKFAYRNTGFKLTLQQFRGLILKKILFSYRNPVLTLAQLLLPVLFTISSVLILKSMPEPTDSPLLTLNLDNFKGTKVPYFFSNQTDAVNLSGYYAKSITGDNKPDSIGPVPGNLTEEVIKHLDELSREDLSYYSLHMPIAAAFGNESQSNTTVTAIFNNQAYHSPGISLAFVDNVIMKYLLNKPDYNVEVINHPFPRTASEILTSQQYQSQAQFQLAQNIMFAMAFLAASFSVLLVRERSIKGKHLQQVCGVRLYLFWISSFLWDYLVYLIPCIFVMMAYLGFQQEGFDTSEQQLRILLVFVVHGLALLPFVYALSFMFDVPSTAYVRICLYSVVLGIGTFLAVIITEIPAFDIQNISKTMDLIYSMFIPNFCLGRSVYNLYTNYMGNKVCTSRYEIEFNGLIFNGTIQDVCNLSNELPDGIKMCCKGLY